MSRDRYFRDELTFLKEQGKVFAETYPQLARFLNSKNTDPDVERLLEGFAFLTARLREKVEDEFPELTHSLINMLWPNYLRPVPSMSIVKFSPLANIIDHKQTLEKGIYLDSVPVKGKACRFQTCRAVDIYPLDVEKVEATHTRDTSYIDLTLVQIGEGNIGTLGLDRLRFYLGGQTYSAQMLYLWLNHYLDHIEVICDDQHITLAKNALRPVGFDSEDGLLPYPKNAYEGYRIIQEYLTFEPAFLFFDLVHLERVASLASVDRFCLRFCFNKSLPAQVLVDEHYFQLYCTPVINLFDLDAEPIDLDGKKTEYKIFPMNNAQQYYDIFSVDSVQGWVDAEKDDKRQRFRVYTPFESFHHEVERAREKKAFYYRIRVRENLRNDGFEHTIAFVRSDETLCIGLHETISLRLTCTNRRLPLGLGKGDIHVPTDNVPVFVSFSNITEPTEPLYPVLGGSLLWGLISNLSLNYLSLLSRDALCSILRLYDFRALVDRQAERISRRRLDGIIAIQSRPIEKIQRGLPIRGLSSTITLSEKAFGSEGDMFLFGSVLSRFFSLYASINSFHELVIINAENKERYIWGVQTGVIPLI